jgi:hypothetical protein
MPEPPATARAILDRIRALTGVKEEGSPENQRRYRDLANTVIGQMLPAGAVKGGAAMYFRYGDASRFSVDLDVSQALAVKEFHQASQERLVAGWGGFTGTIAERPRAEPDGVPEQYVLQPYSINLLYKGSRWPHSISFELSRDELDSTASPEYDISADTLELFEALGLPAPEPVPLVPIVHQMAQKLHAITLPDSERAHDLIDLQLMHSTRSVDLTELAVTTKRLFAFRQTHPWPAIVNPTSTWNDLYQAAREGMDRTSPHAETVAESHQAAVDWANSLLADLASLSEQSSG